MAVFLGIKAGDHLIYIAEAGSDHDSGFEARTNIRRALLDTAGGKVLLADLPDFERATFLRRHRPDEPEMVERFLSEFESIRKTRLATNIRRRGARFAIATAVHGKSGEAVAEVTLVGPTTDLQPRAKKLGQILLKHVDEWARRTASPREVI